MTLLGCLQSCSDDLFDYEQGDMKIRIEQGDNWLHRFDLPLGLSKRNAPQIAVWLEDTVAHYITTIYVSHKAATQDWQAAGGSRRPESLPHWSHSRGIVYPDGLCMPTRSQPLADGISGATPRGSFDLRLIPADALKCFIVKVEVNHSTDFNDSFPKSAMPGADNYSGGREGSGQPAVVYAARVDLASGQTRFEAGLVGHSSPDGSSGDLTSDVSKLTSALKIVERITVEIKR